jgi:Holliday junction resolvase-like predicted endonuclease
MRLDEIENFIRSGKNIEDIFSLFNWREFEEKVEEIFKIHNFKTIKNFRFKTTKRFEIDILAEKRDLLFVVDCKQWSKGRNKTTALKRAAEKNVERAEELKNTLMGKNKIIIPIIISLFDEGIYEHHGVYIVPLFKLNNFLLQF